jgi:ribosomal protein S18 acetylase RimI-like enzyme
MEEDEDPQSMSYQTTFNFKRRMELLKIKAGVTSLLHSRMETIRVGKMLWRKVSSDVSLQGLNDRERLRFLWSDDTFRNKLEKASKLSHEPHVWKGHNFACAPQKADRLCHKMLTAENTITGDIVGFCEVAMLSQPQESLEEECSFGEEPLPTIVNLVTSPEYRRRGVASSILKSASRFVRHEWECDAIALYVEEKNEGAVRMYERFGFEKAPGSTSKQLYMKAALSNVRAQPQRTMAIC